MQSPSVKLEVKAEAQIKLGPQEKTGKREDARRINHGRLVDLSGIRFGKLLVITRAKNRTNPNGKQCTMWSCKCDCGNTLITRGTTLWRGETKSCGCLRKEIKLHRKTTHGHLTKNSPTAGLYCIWKSMNRRCSTATDAAYKNYGERGISVCERWSKSFDDFLLDIGERPSAKHSIDRIDVNGNYEPENCRWATSEEQASNTRKNIFIVKDGVKMTVSQWARKLKISYGTLISRVTRGIPPKDLFTFPLPRRRKLVTSKIQRLITLT